MNTNVQSIDKVVDDLWNEHKALIRTSSEDNYSVIFSQPVDFLDVVISYYNEAVGFITLKYEGEGTYSIVNDTEINSHPSFINTPGHGIEVKREFRKKGVGAALLSIGIGIAQKDWRVHKRGGTFQVVASDITSEGFGCYQNFGFTIQEGMKVSSGHYTDPAKVPEINILLGKVSLFKRLRKRFRL